MSIFERAFTLQGGPGSEIEDERVWYAKLVGYNGDSGYGNTFAGALSSETQEQYQVNLQVAVDGCIARQRSRKINGNVYEACLKANEDGVSGTKEETIPGSEGYHELIKSLAGGKGMCKTRYTYPCVLTVDDVEYKLTWEVDVFYTSDKRELEWVKIDLEIPNDVANVIRAKPNGYDDESVQISAFPLPTIEIFEATFGVIDDKNQERVNEIKRLVGM